MLLEELWELFPIFLVEHSDKWKLYYEEMEDFLNDRLSQCPVKRISHVGVQPYLKYGQRILLTC